jgi:hypothetical protein
MRAPNVKLIYNLGAAPAEFQTRPPEIVIAKSRPPVTRNQPSAIGHLHSVTRNPGRARPLAVAEAAGPA